ncbi:exodeoxyribonuclease III [Aureimonas flava]|uniref:Exodeoxyribonuclease III n=1 Tax=Aureimonas flava TaxID=2320271 RepID=A0A3A1WRW5_9HYPH|nr:exodeoxyribonuclease III [Aureimonas flava]RIY03425.1 exodeoxyribonuclease III [Aureimonas flava]
MLLATWNINGVKARIDTLLAWLDERMPDIVGLQEIKSVDEGFPRAELEARGWHVETHGQKGFNGVALLSREPPAVVERGLPGDASDEQARFIEGVWEVGARRLRFASLYLPNGNPLGTEKFTYKLGWMERLEAHARRRLANETPFVLAGDYNVIPQPEDAKNPAAWVDDALYQPESRSAYRRLLNLGMTDAVRAACDQAGVYTFWDYQAGAWQKDNGIRIDHVALSPEAAAALRSVAIDKHVRGWEKPSDHVPVVVEIDPTALR